MGRYEPLKIGDLYMKAPVVQGGMGVGISLSSLAGAVAKAGGMGLISTAQAPVAADEEAAGPAIVWQAIEKSNVDMVEEMTAMMSSQRALQSAAQVLRMYDQIMSKSVTDIGRL